MQTLAMESVSPGRVDSVGDPLPALVILRHPNQGDALDVRFFATPAAAAAFALRHDDEDMDILIPLAPEEQKPGRRYRQVTDPEELAALAGGAASEQ
jgi:hypothetical protein